MLVEHVPCAPFVNDSERRACTAVLKALRNRAGSARWMVLTNVAHALTREGRADEIDMVVLGPDGLIVIEVKHWDRGFIKSNQHLVEDELDRIERKARRLKGRLERLVAVPGFVAAKLLLTRETKTLGGASIRGVGLYSLLDIAALVEIAHPGTVPDSAIQRFVRELCPRAVELAFGELRRLGDLTELKLLSSPDDHFCRVYSARHTRTQDRLTVYLYDLSVPNVPQAEERSRREFDLVQRLQKSPWLPRLVEGYQPVPGYPGEVVFFALAESGAQTVAEKATDKNWTVVQRRALAVATLRALAELQAPADEVGLKEGVVHRMLTPETVRVRVGDKPLFTGWRWAKLPASQTITAKDDPELSAAFTAPEVRRSGLAIADRRSDIYSLCAVLTILFPQESPEAADARAALELGMVELPDQRADLSAIADAMLPPDTPAAQTETPNLAEATPAASSWDEGALVPMGAHTYRIVNRLGQGGSGRTFKLEQIDPGSGEPIGAYVGKVVLNSDLGEISLSSYQRVRAVAHHPSLAGVYETASKYSPNQLLALLRWIEGSPLGDFVGLLTLHAAELGFGEGMAGAEQLLLRWAEDLCGGLAVLHEHGLAHGDISPGNIIVQGIHVTLIDYDLLTRTNEVAEGQGTPPFAAPAFRRGDTITLADDLYALGATLFHALFDRDPFLFDGIRIEGHGLAWEDGERELVPKIAEFLERAVALDPMQRFADSRAALNFLRSPREGSRTLPIPPPLQPNVVPRLKEILRSYPGSRYGNAETRGLDSPFAHDTYVTTRLDEVIPDEIRSGPVSLVILCGNAGDGKTAFLQHLAIELGAGHLSSEQRVWEAQISGNIKLKVNLDGAAAWRGRDADVLMDELFEPFHNGRPQERRVHLVAVNDGRLMEWVESYERRHDGYGTHLTRQIAGALENQGTLDPHIRFVELNLRSLVGGLTKPERPSSDFFDGLIDRLVGGEKRAEVWQPCQTCTAQKRCPMYFSAQRMGVSTDTTIIEAGHLFRQRLLDAFHAVHQRGEVHITARELKAALSYILFGTRYCTDLHEHPDASLEYPHDLAFDPLSSLRQGELLRELSRLDPSLEAHARLDRYLTGRGAPDPAHGAERYPELARGSARRRAYFEWTDSQIAAVGGHSYALGLAGGARLRAFRDFPRLQRQERDAIRNSLCYGLSRLDALPPAAFGRAGFAPVRIAPRTPTETAFWIDKCLDRFSLEEESFNAAPGLETLHRHLTLTYSFDNNRTESLRVSLELFALLMDLSEGVQILDAFSDDVFANLGVFTERLSQEDETTVSAWNPAAGGKVFSVRIDRDKTGAQVISMRPTERLETSV